MPPATDSGARDDRPQQRPRVNPQGTRWDVRPDGYTPPPPATATGQGEQSASAQDATAQGSSATSSSAQASLTPDMLAQLLQHTLQTSQQQATQMTQLLAQTTQIQQQILQAQTRPRPSRKKSDPPRFDGSDQDDLELWIFSTEQYYSEFRTEMHDFSSNFSDMVFANLGTDAQAWYRDVKISLGASPLTWSVFKERIRVRFRDKDFKFKTLTKMYELKATKSQQEYTSRFLHLLSQVDTKLPEVVKRWFFQQNLHADTAAYISRNVPDTLEQAIEMAQRFEDAKPASTRPPAKEPATQNAKANNSSQGNNKSKKNASKDNPIKQCNYCKRKNHTEDECRTKNARISNHVAKCFVDSGSSFNAISPKLAQKLDVEVKQCPEPLSVKMDASDFAVGGYLYQLDEKGDERVIAYGGRKLSEAELKYPTREKELLAALFAMRTWHVYLIDKPFMISTDHRTLETILQQKTCSQRLARWLNELGMYQPLFKWIKGDSNIVADFASRNPGWKQDTTAISLAALLKHIRDDNENNGVSTHLYASQHRGPSHNIQERCSELCQSDVFFGPIVKQLQAKDNSGAAPHAGELPKNANIDHYELQDSLLFFRSHPSQNWRLCVPDNRELRDRILFEEHDSVVRGHPGSSKTLKFMQQKYYWPSMARDIRSYCATCEMCMRTKTSRSKSQGLLHPLDVPEDRWKHITMDFVTSLPETKPHRHNAVMVIVDRLTKRAHFVATKSTATAQDTAKLFRDNFQRLHGHPVSIVCDRDSKFTSKFWTKLLDLQNTKLKPSSAFKPSTDGQTEITNRFLGDFLRAYVNPHQTYWNEFLALAEFAYNSRAHDSIGMAPFVADLGYLPRSVSDLAVPPRDGPRSASRFVDTQQTILIECQDALDQAQQRMKFYYDRNRPATSFRVGDQVLLDTSNLALHHVGNDGKRSLAPKYIGPYPVLKITTPDTYKIGLPPSLKLHDEFHVSRLRRYKPDNSATRDNRVPALITRDGSLGLQVKEILKHRVRRGANEYLIRWYGSANQDSWEPAESLIQVRGLIDAFHARANSSRPRTRSQAAQATTTPLS